MRPIPVLLLALAGAACSPSAPEGGAGAASGAAASPASSAVPATSAAPVGGAREVKESTALYELEYVYPAAAGAIPKLKEWLDEEIGEDREDLIKDAREQQEESRKGGFPFRPLGRWVKWQVVTDLPGWLSLSAQVSTYEGGAHPNHFADALVWDKQAGKRRDPLDFFTSKDALSAAIRKDFCRLLDRQRAAKRGAPVKPGSTDAFDECIDPVKSTVILGSSNGKAFDRLGVLVAPYEAGPYAEGSYDVTLPVTPAVLALVKPEFRSTFVVAH